MNNYNACDIYNTCDICGTDKNVVAGRWIFYCPEHEDKDRELAVDNELVGGEADPEYMLNDPDYWGEMLGC